MILTWKIKPSASLPPFICGKTTEDFEPNHVPLPRSLYPLLAIILVHDHYSEEYIIVLVVNYCRKHKKPFFC